MNVSFTQDTAVDGITLSDQLVDELMPAVPDDERVTQAIGLFKLVLAVYHSVKTGYPIANSMTRVNNETTPTT